MKITHRQPERTADVSSARDTTGRELLQLVLSAVGLLVALFFIVGWSVDFVVARISFETEAKIFKHFSLPAGDATEAPDPMHLERAGDILAKLRQAPGVPPLPYRLVILDKKTPNAFAFPGGTIGVTTGLLDMLEENIALAFVLGHELGHFRNRDHLQGMGRAIGFRIILAVIFGAGSDSFANMIEFVIQRGYSQEAETSADRFGLELVYTAFGRTEGVDRLFRILQDQDDMPAWAYMFATHPSPARRIDDLAAYAASLEPHR